jgi:serine/threonine-protein kinase
VIHRDIKPENILLCDGRVLVSDFGIALAVSNAGGERLTQTGISLGTPQYMSPEQATGDRVIDARTDIYSLGALVYEMLTGDPPHTASTAQGVIARILTEVPVRAGAIRPSVPAHVDDAIARALAKLPADRWPNVAAFSAAMAHRNTAGAKRWSSYSRLRLTGIAVAAVVFAGSAWLWRYRLRSNTPESVSFVLEPPADLRAVGGEIGDVAISPDGKMLAYVISWDTASVVYVRRVDEVASRRVPGTERAMFLSFSPSGKWLGVATSDSRLVKAAVDGSSALTLAQNHWGWGGPSWESEQSLILFGDQLLRISAEGGEMRPITRSPPHFAEGYAVVAPDHETVVFGELGPAFTEDDVLAIGSLKTGEYRATSLLMNRPIGVVDGHIVYVTTTGAIKAVTFDARTQRVTGDPRRIMEGLIFDISNAKMSATGTLMYRTGRRINRLVSEKDGRRTELLTNIEGHPNWLSHPRVSPDGRRIVLSIQAPRGDTLTSDIWILDRGTRALTRVTSLGNVVNPVWTPDGRAIVYNTWFFRNPAVWIQPLDGSTLARPLATFEEGTSIRNPNPATDSGVTICVNPPSAESWSLFYLSLAPHAKPQRIAQSPACMDQVSPDGRWLAQPVNDGQRVNIYIRPFRRAGPAARVSVDGGQRPRWSRDGRSVYFSRPVAADNSGYLVRAQLRFTGDGVEVVRRDSIAPLTAGPLYDVAEDGTVVRLEPIPSANQVVVKTNWLPDLRAKLR